MGGNSPQQPWPSPRQRFRSVCTVCQGPRGMPHSRPHPLCWGRAGVLGCLSRAKNVHSLEHSPSPVSWGWMQPTLGHDVSFSKALLLRSRVLLCEWIRGTRSAQRLSRDGLAAGLCAFHWPPCFGPVQCSLLDEGGEPTVGETSAHHTVWAGRILRGKKGFRF